MYQNSFFKMYQNSKKKKFETDKVSWKVSMPSLHADRVRLAISLQEKSAKYFGKSSPVMISGTFN